MQLAFRLARSPLNWGSSVPSLGLFLLAPVGAQTVSPIHPGPSIIQTPTAGVGPASRSVDPCAAPSGTIALHSTAAAAEVCGAFADPAFSYEYAREAWNSTGREWLSKYGGIDWNGKTWVLDESWSEAPWNVAQRAYTLEHALRPGIHMAYFRPDPALLDEIAGFLVAYRARFTRVGALRALTQYDTGLLRKAGPDEKRTLAWIQTHPSGRPRVRECTLCNGQFYHPIARLIRLVATLPASARTASMKKVARWYGPLLVNDWLMWELYGEPRRIDAWTAIAAGWVSGNWPGPFFGDNEMWVLASAAEILGANRSDPALVPLSREQKAQLKEAVRFGVGALNRYRTYYPDTRNLHGVTVGSMTYFNGMLADHPDNAFAGYINDSYPTLLETRRVPDVSLDVSHFYRVPVLLRALRDNRAATGVNTPSDSEIRLLINHYLYRTLTGDFDAPLFSNYFDGTNGWYRVGYYDDAAYSPVQHCNARDKIGGTTYHCLFNPGGVMGWGLLARLSPDLMELQHKLLQLAWNEDPSTVAFKNQFYYYRMPFSPRDASGRPQHPPSLLWIMGAIPDALH